MIELTEIESAKASRFFAEACSLRFVSEIVDADLEVTEADLSAEKAKLEFLQNKLASLASTRDQVKKMLESSETALNTILREVVFRLDPTADPGAYSTKIVDGSIVALDKE